MFVDNRVDGDFVGNTVTEIFAANNISYSSSKIYCVGEGNEYEVPDQNEYIESK